MIQSSVASVESLGGGKYQTTIGVSPRFYVKNGVWREFTSTLGSSGDPNLNIGCDELFDFRIRDKLTGNAPVFHLGKGNSHVRMTPLNTNNVDGVVSGNSITFPEAWNNADLRYTLGGHILRKDITLREGHPTSFSFRVDDKSGLDDDLQGADFYAPAPYLYYPDPVGGIGSRTYYRNREVAVTKSTQGGKRIYTYTLPDGLWAGWVLDPTLTAQPDGTAGLDTYISNITPTTNYGTSASVQVQNTDDTYDVFEVRTLIKFDLSSITAGSTINSATFTLTQISGQIGNDTMAVFRVLRAWSETQATWNVYTTGNNWGTAGCNNTTTDRESANIGSLLVTSLAGAKNWTLTASKIQEMITGGSFTNNGFIVLQTSAVANNLHEFRSSDYGTATDRPKLVVDYTEGGGATVKVLTPTHRIISRGVRVL